MPPGLITKPLPEESGMTMTFEQQKVVWHFETPAGPKIHDGAYRHDPSQEPKQDQSCKKNLVTLLFYNILNLFDLFYVKNIILLYM